MFPIVWFALLTLCAAAIDGCNESLVTAEEGGDSTQRRQWEMLQTEFALAEAKTPYLVIDSANRSIEIRLGGAVIWNEVVEWVENAALAGNREDAGAAVYDYVAECRLLEHEKRYPDTLLQVISNALKVEQELLQRELPLRFQIRTAKGLVMAFEASDDSLRQERGGSLMQKFDGLFSFNRMQQRFTVKLPLERAMTLYYLSQPGAPVLFR